MRTVWPLNRTKRALIVQFETWKVASNTIKLQHATACYSNFQKESSTIGAVRRCDASCRGTAPWLAWEHRFAPAPPSIVEQARREFHKRQVCRETSKNFRCKKKNCSFPAKTGFPLFSQRTLFEMLPTNHRHQHPIIQRQGHVNQGIVRHHTQDNSLCCLFVEPGNCTEWQTEKTVTSLQWLRPNPRTVLHSNQPSMKDAPLDPLDQNKSAMSCFTHLQHFEMFGKSTWSNLKQFELFEFRRGTLMQGPVVATASPSSQPRRTPQWRGGSRAAGTSPPGTLPAGTSCPSSPSRHPPCSWRCPRKDWKTPKTRHLRLSLLSRHVCHFGVALAWACCHEIKMEQNHQIAAGPPSRLSHQPAAAAKSSKLPEQPIPWESTIRKYVSGSQEGMEECSAF